MVEPEVAFANLNDVILLADNLLKTIIANTLKNYPSEMKILNDLKNGTLIPTLKDFINKDLKILDYKEAIKILEKNKKMFEDQNIFFGMDLSSEHEKFIAEKIVNGPVALINYPKELKAFYMYQNTDNKTVAAFDLLVPGIGELMGGSQRESRYKKLEQRLKELNIKQEPLQ
jgi:asparagine--tRNA ligase